MLLNTSEGDKRVHDDFTLISERFRRLGLFYTPALPVINVINRYNHYLAVDMMASSEEEHRAWVGWVESRLRKVLFAVRNIPVSLSPLFSIYLYGCMTILKVDPFSL